MSKKFCIKNKSGNMGEFYYKQIFLFIIKLKHEFLLYYVYFSIRDIVFKKYMKIGHVEAIFCNFSRVKTFSVFFILVNDEDDIIYWKRTLKDKDTGSSITPLLFINLL